MGERESTNAGFPCEIDLLNRRIAVLEMLDREHKLAMTYRDLGRDVLQILNEPGDLKMSIERVLAALKARTGFDAVGIRLQSGDDFPYFVQEGFTEDFLLKENTLIEHGPDGGVCRNSDGSARLECTCGMVLSGKTRAAGELCSPGGSFWTNDSFPLLEIPRDQDPRHHPRNECIHHGYASVALVPIKTRDRVVGLIHLNDRRKSLFTIEIVELLEGIGAHIGIALMRKQDEDALREKVALLDKVNRQMAGRELRIIEIKKEVNALCKELGRPAPYTGGVS